MLQLAGHRAGRLLAISVHKELSKRTGKIYWKCKCDCGKSKLIYSRDLVSGRTNSCGCLRKELAAKAQTKHGLSRTISYSRWSGMMARCYRKTVKQWKDYGGRGIKVCKHWHKFENFYKDMGNPPNQDLTLERINNDKGYSKENCRWATRAEQSRNTRRKKQKVDPKFKEFCEEARNKAWDIFTGIKNSGYNSGGVSIRNYWKYRGTRDIAYMCHQKALRAISVTDGSNSEAKKLSETVKDTAVDLINYAMFLYAEQCCREEEQTKAHSENHESKAKFIDSLSGAYKGEAPAWRPSNQK